MGGFDLTRSGWAREGRSPSRYWFESPLHWAEAGLVARVEGAEQMWAKVDGEHVVAERPATEFFVDKRLTDQALAVAPLAPAFGVGA